MNTKTYLDYAATTPVDSRVLEAMLPYFRDTFGNPSSVHTFGQQAEAALEESRETLAKGLNCRPDEVIFTGCGSESDNLALRGAALGSRTLCSADHILISPVEHHAVSRTAHEMAAHHGFEVEYLPVDEHGAVDPELVQAMIRPTTAVVSVMYANNEIGTINQIAEIGAICQKNHVLFHTDAVQAAGYLPVDTQTLNVDLLSLGAHKFYGPKGIGALYVRKGIPIVPAQTGGSQEFGLRAGTHNIPYIVGMARAFELAIEERISRVEHVRPLRDQLIKKVLEEIPDVQLTGHPTERLPNHASFVFNKVDGNALLSILDIEGYACSSGSACKTGDPEPSDVLLSIGFDREWALGSLRVTLGAATTSSQVKNFGKFLPEAVERTRSLFRV